MRRSLTYLISSALLLAGCAKSPSGGPTTPQSPNRLTVTMVLQQPVNPTYYYAFAFDTDDNSATGPAAIVSSTVSPNGVVGGDFTVLVLVRGGQFQVFRRTRNGASETLEPATQAFVTQPSPPNGRAITFTLNLDANTDSGTRLFRNASGNLPSRLDVNFITTNELRRDPNDNRLRAYDALGQTPFAPNSFFNFSIRSSGSITNADVREPTGDVLSNDTSNVINEAQLDITDFSVQVQRG